MSTQLRELFDGAAESQPPHDLAARAITGARSRRRQRYTVSGSVLAAAAVVLGFAMVSSSQRLDGAPRPDEVAGLPDELPAANGLPKLTADTMSFALAAYVVDGKVVVVDAATGQGALVDFDTTPPGYVGDVTPRIGADASLALSPNGRFLMVSSGATSLSPGREWLWLVDVATGQVGSQGSLALVAPTPSPESVGIVGQVGGQGGGQGGVELPPQTEGATAVPPSRMAWSPDGQTFACICSFSRTSPAHLLTTEMSALPDGLVVNSIRDSVVTPRQISWGTDGLVGQFDGVDGEWRMFPDVGDATEFASPAKWDPPPYWDDQVALPNTVVMSLNPEGGHLASSGAPFYRINTPDAQFFMSTGGRRLQWGPLADGYFVLIRPGYAEPGDPNEVLRLDDGGQHDLTTVPQNTAAVSFATDLG